MLAPDLSCYFSLEDENCVEILRIPTLKSKKIEILSSQNTRR